MKLPTVFFALATLALFLQSAVAMKQNVSGARNLYTELYEKGGGRYWYNNTGWSSDGDSCSFYGVTCDSQGKIISVNLADNNVYFSESVSLSIYRDTLVELNLSNCGSKDDNIKIYVDGLKKANFERCRVELAGDLSRLEEFNIARARVDNIGIDFKNAVNLRVLNISSTRPFDDTLEDALPLMKYWKNLETLDMSHNDFRYLTLVKEEWKNLKYLDASYNGITHVYGNYIPGSRLETLILSMNDITYFPYSIGLFSNLTYLDTSFNDGQVDFRSDFSMLSNLKTFIQSGSPANVTLPASAKNLKTYECRKCSFTAMPALPESLSNLDLSYNNISSVPVLPSGIAVVDLSNNKMLKNIPNVSEYTHLTSLDVSETAFTSIPEELFALPHFDSLKVSGCSLTSLPAKLTTVNWRELHLADVKLLQSIDLSASSKLESLDLSGNNLSEADIKLTYTPNLQELDLHRNNLSRLPISSNTFCKMTNFRYLDVSDNARLNVYTIPKCVCQKDGMKINVNFDYCDETEECCSPF